MRVRQESSYMEVLEPELVGSLEKSLPDFLYFSRREVSTLTEGLVSVSRK